MAAASSTEGWSLSLAWDDLRVWKERLASDYARALENQSAAQREITETLRERARESGASGFALTGSTARARRTKISDLDYHVIGKRPPHNDLPDDVDVYATDEIGMWRKLNEGDDFIQWTLRFGCVLDDDGPFRGAMQKMSSGNLWPTADQKLSRLPGHIEMARRLVDMGDRDAAQDQVRATLTSLARALLLRANVFPRARSELPAQLEGIGAGELSSWLLASICEEPTLDELGEALGSAELFGSPSPSKPRKQSVG